MKNFIITSVLFFSSLAFSQKKTITFDHLYKYSLKTSDSKPIKDSVTLSLYSDSAKNSILFESRTNSAKNDIMFYIDKKVFSGLTVGLDGELYIPTDDYLNYRNNEFLSEFFNAKIEFLPTNRKGNFLGIDCQYYSLNSKDVYYEYSSNELPCFCIDTSNTNKNLKLLFPNSNLDGLLLTLNFAYLSNAEFTLDTVQKIIKSINFDYETALKNLETNSEYHRNLKDESIEQTVDFVEEDAYNSNINLDPLCNSNVYFSEFNRDIQNLAEKFTQIGCYLAYNFFDYKSELPRNEIINVSKKQTEVLLKQALKSKVITKDESKKLAKAFDNFYNEASLFIPKVDIFGEKHSSDIWNSSEFKPEFREYISQYNELNINDIYLASELQTKNEISKNMPEYCSEINEKIPNFENQNLKMHVYNFVGQICDLYLYQNGGNVDYFLTIDSMRKSLLEIENMRSKLSVSDSTLLTNYLNSLD